MSRSAVWFVIGVITLAGATATALTLESKLIVPVCALVALILSYGLGRLGRTASPDHRSAGDSTTETRLQEVSRINAELTQELMESRIIEESKELQVRAFDAFLQGVFICDPQLPDMAIIYCNDGFLRLTGYRREEVVGRNCRFLQGKDTDPATVDRVREAMNRQRSIFVEILNYRKDGTTFWNALGIAPIVENGIVTHFVGVLTDITQFKLLESQLRQSQKMEAVGHLAGGVAHDFNNLLTVINGCCELLDGQLGLPEESRMLVSEIRKAGERAATLTRQLLAFSRKTVLKPKVLSLHDLVSEFQRMLSRLIGEDIDFETDFRSPTGRVRVDPGQIEQVIMNLAANARDAMPQGGLLRIGTRDVTLTSAHAAEYPDVKPGRFVMLTVSDNGCGMDDAVRARIFEPFFSTKPVGKGTGLGLAMVYGIVKASGGHIAVDSKIGIGTTFRIYLPVVEEPTRKTLPTMLCELPKGSETILVVEDEEGVRLLVRQALTAQGFRVIEASDGRKAIDFARDSTDPIDLVVSDVVMPHMGGREMWEQVRLLHQETRVLFMSGHTDDAMVRHGVREADVNFIQKPFTMNQLLRTVREVLDRKNQDQPVNLRPQDSYFG